MVKLRLRRKGKKFHPVYDIVAVDGRSRRDGAYLERLGYYDPNTPKSTIKIDHNRAIYWLNNGAQPTDITRHLLSYDGVLLRRTLEFKKKSASEIEQEVEKHKDQPWSDHFIGGKIEQFVVRDNYAYTKVDATKAYPGKALKGWKRWAILDKENNIVILLDEVKCARGSEIDVLFHPNVEAKLTGNVMSLKGVRADMEMTALFKGGYVLETGRQLHHQIVQSGATRWIPYYHTFIEKAPAETNYIASIFYPTAIKSETRFTLDENGSAPVITGFVNGKKMQYTIAVNDVTLTVQ